MSSNIALGLKHAGDTHKNRPAVALGRTTLQSYAQLAERAARLAAGLRDKLGLQPGDRVVIASKNRPEYVEAMYGVWWGGFAAVPANAKLHGVEFRYILENSGAQACLVGPELFEAIAEHRPDSLEHLVVLGGDAYAALFDADPARLAEVDADDLAWLFFTSGTTGRPKGAMLTHGNMSAMAQMHQDHVDPTETTDCIIHAAPLSHGSGIYMIPHVNQAACNVIPESGSFEPAEIFDLAEAWGSMSLFAAPTMVKRMTESPTEPPARGFRGIVYGGGPMYVKDARAALERFGPCLVEIYGQGESPMTITVCNRTTIADKTDPKWEAKLASVGQRFPELEVMIADADDNAVAPGESGEIMVRGATVMNGYWQNAEATAETLKGGWLHTGDMGSLDEDGYLTLMDRGKDLVISGGSNIYPREIEEVLLQHPNVSEVSVIGRPNPEWGEIPVAYVVGQATPPELDALCLENIARFKRPKDYVFVDELPKNNYGKILKTELRQRDHG